MTYQIGDFVIASDIALDVKGEIVQLINEKEIKPAGWCFQWAKPGGKPSLWMPIDSIIRHATPEEIASAKDVSAESVRREIEKHRRAIEILEKKLKEFI